MRVFAEREKTVALVQCSKLYCVGKSALKCLTNTDFVTFGPGRVKSCV